MHSHILIEYAAGTSILSLAKKYNFPPSLLARGVVENITVFEKKETTKAMRDPLGKLNIGVILEQHRSSEQCNMKKDTPITDPFSGTSVPGSSDTSRLAREVMEATNSDPLYGPRFDKERNYIGIEYEIILERALRSMSEFFFNSCPLMRS